MTNDTTDDLGPAYAGPLPVRTGPGTPGGDLLRRYWQPVVLLADFPPGSPPLALKLLGEQLVLYRDGAGRLGLLGLRCAHRCADLSYGRIEHDGLRCIYHGWLYDAAGRCLDQPAEPGGGANRDRIRQRAYPCVERGSAVWTYMGPGEPPLFPDYPPLSAPDEYRFAARWRSSCNYLQANEGNVDPVHTSYLHAYDVEPESTRDDDLRKRHSQEVFGVDTAPRVSTHDTRFGMRVLTQRRLPESGKQLLRVTNFVMPNACAIGGAETPFGRGGASMFWHVPIDDTSHWRYEFIFHSKAALPRAQLRRNYDGEMDAQGVPYRNAANRYGQKREDMDRSFLGMGPTFPCHDLFVTESQGPILDRAAEHLVTSDVGIARMRRRLLEALDDVAAGRDPCGVVRNAAENDFRDLLVMTESIDAEADLEQFIVSMQAADIYRLNPDVARAGGKTKEGTPC
jgi:phthalate 4,5-dioxygenase oxygenase subunit